MRENRNAMNQRFLTIVLGCWLKLQFELIRLFGKE